MCGRWHENAGRKGRPQECYRSLVVTGGVLDHDFVDILVDADDSLDFDSESLNVWLSATLYKCTSLCFKIWMYEHTHTNMVGTYSAKQNHQPQNQRRVKNHVSFRFIRIRSCTEQPIVNLFWWRTINQDQSLSAWCVRTRKYAEEENKMAENFTTDRRWSVNEKKRKRKERNLHTVNMAVDFTLRRISRTFFVLS